jgi:flagellar biogenesis protein FliO
MRPTILFFFISFLIITLPTALYSADKKECLIDNIKHSSTLEMDTLHLKLNCQFSSLLSYHFDYGITEITIPGTSVKKELYYKINNRFLKDINIQNSGTNTILVVSFADAKEQKIGLFDHEITNNQIIIRINRKIPSTQSFDAPEITQENQSITTGFLEDSQVSIIKMLSALFFILLIIYAILWLYKRFTNNRFNFKNQKYDIQLISSHHIGTKQKIAIIEINKVPYACGITPNSINIISQVSDQNFWSYLKTTDYNINSDQSVDFTKIKQEYTDFKKAQEVVSSPPKPTFANEFLKKVKNLKPID